MELCDGTLTDLVPRAKQQCNLPGLPPLDTVSVGLMLCSALEAVHRRARCLHLDLTPGNVLLALRGVGGGETHSVRLSDFGLSKNLPSCVLSTMNSSTKKSVVSGVAKGTPGYAPKEQLMRKGQRRSDIYSLGATLLYAATGVHPFGGEPMEAIMFQLMTGADCQHMLPCMSVLHASRNCLFSFGLQGPVSLACNNTTCTASGHHRCGVCAYDLRQCCRLCIGALYMQCPFRIAISQAEHDSCSARVGP